MSGLPGGAVTFLFSDIEGSTRLVKALRERYPRVLAEHRRLVRAAIAAHGGHEVDTQGDAFFAAFGGATQAVLCALEIQRALAAHGWPGGVQVRVRIGIHTGQAVLAGGAYTGLAVHRAARICAAARGGQVLISQATQTLIEDEEEPEPGFTLVEVGEYRLKDLDRPVRLFQLAAAGLEAPSVPGRGRQAPGARAGRGGGCGGGARVAGGADEFHRPGRAGTRGRGPAGGAPAGDGDRAGRLGEDPAGRRGGPAGGGPVRGRGLAGGAGAGGRSGAGPGGGGGGAGGAGAAWGAGRGGRWRRVLARQQLLLVLDNCEHVIGAAAALCAELLAACDDLRILATSREPLRVAGEARYRLGPLAVPDPDDLAEAAGAEAVVLFADRARGADAHFVLDGRTGPEVARLVARLDGMPLAIELAAARVEALGVGRLLDRLEDRFALLAGGDRAAPPRQRSLAATVEWSYQLLEEDERRVFRAVSVFPGPFTLEGAEAVAGTGRRAGGAAAGGLLAAGPAAHRRGRAVPVRDAGNAARLRGEAAGRGRRAGHGGRRAGRVCAAGGRGGRGRAADRRRGGGRGPVAGCRGPRHAPGAGLGHGPRRGPRGAAGGRAGLVVVAARPAARPVPAAARGGRAGRAGQRGVVRHPMLAGPGRVSSRPTGRGAGPFHRGPGCRGGPGAVPGAGRCPGRPVGRHC